MFRIGKLYHWFSESGRRFSKRGYTGPQFASIVMKDGTLVDFDFFNHNDINKISTTKAEDAAGVIVLCPSDNCWSIEATNELTGAGIYSSGCPGKEEAAKLLLEMKREREGVEQAILDDPVKHLERELSTCDWYSHYSDDYGVWAAGEAHLRRIRELLDKVPAAIAKELWQKYAPQDCTCPIP